MKKVLFCIGQLFGGGAERVVSVWAQQLANAGFSISILIYGHGDNEYIIPNTVKIFTIVNKYEDYKTLSPIQRILRIRNIIKEINPDTIISFLPRMQISVMISTLGLDIRRVETIRNNPWRIKHNNIIEEYLWKKCLESSDALILQTNGQREYVSSKKWGKCYVIPNPIASEYLHNKKKKYESPIRKFVAVGRISEQKNYTIMLQAFSKACAANIDDITLDIYGSGSDESIRRIQNTIKSLKLTSNICLKGKVDNLYQILHEYDAFLMTSNFEGMPNALVEAMSTGLVCISTDCETGPKDLIRHGITGYLAKTGDCNSIAEKIIEVTNLIPKDASAIGDAAMEFIGHYCGEENSIDKLIDLLMK